MNKIRLDILIYEEDGNLAHCLECLQEDSVDLDLSLFCLCDTRSNRSNDTGLRKKVQETTINQQRFDSRNKNFMELANELFLTDDDGFILFLSSRITPSARMTEILIKKLKKDNKICGVNPLLLTGWANEETCAFLGAACDFQYQLHYLYEGLAAGDPLAQKERFFQFAHPGALLIRKKDFYAAGGFNTKLDYLAFYEFCIRFASSGKNFTVLPECKAKLLNRFDAWKFCGTWNSAMQSGRLLTGNVKPTYPKIAAEDNINWQLDSWLNEYADLAWGSSGSPEYKAWLQWRHHPNPVTLLQYIVQLPLHLQKNAVELGRLLPASLPKTSQYYDNQVTILKNNAVAAGFSDVVAAADKWKKAKGSFIRYILKPGVSLLQKQGIYNCSLATSTAVFNAWVEIGEKLSSIQIGAQWPELAVVMPVYNPDPAFLQQAINSVIRQDYPRWQLCIADDASTNPDVTSLLRSYKDGDSRIKIVFRKENGHICKATNSALELVEAPFTGFMDNDDMLAPEALGLMAKAIIENPTLHFLYSDEDHIDAANIRSSPLFKQDFNRDQFLAGHLSVYSTQAIRLAGGLRPGLEGSQDFDLALRITEKLDNNQIAHIPHILYHWRIHEKSTSSSVGAKPYVLEATRAAWLASSERHGETASVIATIKNNFYNLAYQVKNLPACSVIFFSDAQNPLPNMRLYSSLKSFFSDETEFLIQPLEKIKDCCHNHPENMRLLPFCADNWAKSANNARQEAKGDILLFLYAGLEPMGELLTEQLVYHCLRKDTGASGGLIWKNGYLVNGGWYPDKTGIPFILHQHLPHYRLKDVSWGQFLLTRHVLGISWQCACVRKEWLDEYGSFKEAMGSLAFLDYCLAQIRNNKNIMATPFAQWENGRDEWFHIEEMNKIVDTYGSFIKSSGLRNANLCAAPDYGWTLIF